MSLLPVLLPCGQLYIVSPKHRKTYATEDASVWLVDSDAEMNCFNEAFTSNWTDDGFAWGLISEGLNRLAILGKNYQDYGLRIAKFRSDAVNWHGYPADNNNRPQDRPRPVILDAWSHNGLISKSLRSRIQGGRL